nr:MULTISPECIES: hypothetical protein [unclassified Mesorhizobium]
MAEPIEDASQYIRLDGFRHPCSRRKDRAHTSRVAGCGADREASFKEPLHDPAPEKACSAEHSGDPFRVEIVRIHRHPFFACRPGACREDCPWPAYEPAVEHQDGWRTTQERFLFQSALG